MDDEDGGEVAEDDPGSEQAEDTAEKGQQSGQIHLGRREAKDWGKLFITREGKRKEREKL